MQIVHADIFKNFNTFVSGACDNTINERVPYVNDSVIHFF